MEAQPREMASSSGDVEKVVERQQPSRRTTTSAFVQREAGVALHNELQQATNVHVSAQTGRNMLHEGGMMARCPQVGQIRS